MEAKPPRSNFMFVYGTLKKGFRANYKLKDSIYIGQYETPPMFGMVSVGFPIVFPVDDGHSVIGEVYICSDEELRDLDLYEGCPHHYQRMRIPVAGLATGATHYEPWIYFQKARPSYGSREVRPDDKGYLVWDEQPSRIAL